MALKGLSISEVPLPQCRNGQVKRITMNDKIQAMVKKVGLISLGGGSYAAWRALFEK